MSAEAMGSIRTLLLAASLAGVGGCATPVVTPKGEPEEPVFQYDVVVPPDVDRSLLVSDPWEPMNRAIYRFNAHADKYVLLPLVRGYRFVTPQFVRTGVQNAYTNFFGIRTFANELLQFRPKEAVQTLGRFVVNSTVGLLGLFDVASKWGMPYYEEDFGQTLGRWGVGPGPYLVIPLLGPSSVRGGVGQLTDAVWMGALDPLKLDDSETRRYVYYGLLVLEERNAIAFRYYETGSPFEYELVRLMITTKRELDVEK